MRDPICLEGKSIQVAKDVVVMSNNSNSFIAVRARLSLSRMKAWFRGTFSTSDRNENANEAVGTPKLPDAEMFTHIQIIRDIDQKDLPSFTEIGDLANHLNSLYRPYAEVVISPIVGNSEAGLKALSVDDMQVDEGLRGLGVGRHMRATILRFSDENNYAVLGIPTSAGDGTVEFEHPAFKEHALAHRQRLEKFYLDSGYEYNYAFEPAYHSLFDPLLGRTDELTGEEYPNNPEWKEQFSPEALMTLEDSGLYVRWPNSEIPKSWKA